MGADGGLVLRDLGGSDRSWRLHFGAWDATAIPASAHTLGFGRRYRGRGSFGAVFIFDGAVWLQVDGHRWKCDDLVAVRQVRERARSAVYDITTMAGTTERVTVRFTVGTSLLRLAADYDELTSHDDDIVKMLPYVEADGWTATSQSVSGWAAWFRDVYPAPGA